MWKQLMTLKTDIMDTTVKNMTRNWKCPECNELNEENYAICWNCQYEMTGKEELLESIERHSTGAPDIKEIYYDNFPVSDIPEEKFKEYKNHCLCRVNIIILIFVHIVTFGLSSIIYFGLIHGKLPKIRHDDFGTLKALGFLLVPILNIYWIFVFWLRLIDRLNFQLKIRKDSFRISSAPAVGIIIYQLFVLLITILVPEVAFLILFFLHILIILLTLILVAQGQTAINKIVALDRTT